MNQPRTPPTRPVLAWWASWCDGLWLCVGFGIAVSVAFSIPAAVLTWVWKAAGQGPTGTLVQYFGAAFLLVVSPLILSRLFREMDYPGRPAEKSGRRDATSTSKAA